MVDQAPPEPPPYVEPASEHAIGAAYTVVDYETAFYSVTYGAIGAVSDAWFRPGIAVRSGLRLAFGDLLSSGYALEGMVSVALTPHFGTIFDAQRRTASWRPMLGVELGATSARIIPRSPTPLDTTRDLLRTEPSTPFYGVFLVRPLRFRFTNFEATILGLAFGSHLLHPGRELRIQIDLLEVSYVL